MSIAKHTRIGMLTFAALINFCTTHAKPNKNMPKSPTVEISQHESAEQKQAKLTQEIIKNQLELYKNKMDQLNSLVHPIWPETSQKSPWQLMIMHQNYADDMVLFIVSMIPGTTQLQTQSLKIGHEANEFSITLLKANTGYRIYLTPASKVEEASNYLTAYQHGMRYNPLGKNFINPLSGSEMLFVASFNAELGHHQKNNQTVHITLPPYQQDMVQQSNYLPKIENPNFIFGS